MSDAISKDKKQHQSADNYWGNGSAIFIALAAMAAIPIIGWSILSGLAYGVGFGEKYRTFFESESAASTLIISGISAVFTLGLLYIVATRLSRRYGVSVRDIFGLRWPKFSDAGYAIAGFFVYMTISILGVIFIVTPLGLDNGAKQDVGFESLQTNPLFALLALVILPPVVEELVFRGFLYGSFRRRGMRVWLAVAITSLLFGGLHLFGSSETNFLWTAAVDVSALAIVLALLREKTGAVWASIFLHMLKNSMALIALFAGLGS